MIASDTLIHHINKFNPTRCPVDENNQPTSSTAIRIKVLNGVEQLAYSLYAKPFVINYRGHQNEITSKDINPHPTLLTMGPVDIELKVDPISNALLQLDFIPGFDEIKKVELDKNEFILKYGKNISAEVLESLHIDGGNSAFCYDERLFTRNKSELVSDVESHWFKPVFNLIKSYNRYQRPTIEKDITIEYLDFTRKMKNRVLRKTTGDQLFTKPGFCLSRETPFTCFNMNSKADLITGFVVDEGKSDPKQINFGLILEAKVPTTNVLSYLSSKLAHNHGQDKSRPTLNPPGKKKFDETYLKLIKQMIRSNCSKGIITDYEYCLFLELSVNHNQLELTYSLYDTKETYHFRYLLFSFLTIQDFDREKDQRSKICDLLIYQASVYVSDHQNQYQRTWGIGDSATTASTATTEFSSNLNNVRFKGNAPVTTESADENLKQAVKILGDYPYEPVDIAKKFKGNDLVLFKHNPELIATSRNEIIEVDRSIMQDFGYDIDEISSVGSKIVIKLAPIESLFVDVDGSESSEDDYGHISHSKYQKSVDSIYHELKIHLKVLQHYSDLFVVRILHFGFMADHTNFADTGSLSDWRFNGAYILMDKVENVKELSLEEMKLLPPEVKTKIIAYYQKLHGIDIIHNDVKPSNLFATSDGEVIKIIDFGNSYESDNESNKVDEMRIVKDMLGV